MKTSFPKSTAPTWFLVDAGGKVLGRLATSVAKVLHGKHRAAYVPHMPSPDHVIVINAEKVVLTGRKREQKSYFRHTGYFGSLRETGVDKLLQEDPCEVMRLAVKGMLPKNATRERVLRQLHVYRGSDHKHAAQNPVPLVHG